MRAHSKKMQKHVASINSLVACLETDPIKASWFQSHERSQCRMLSSAEWHVNLTHNKPANSKMTGLLWLCCVRVSPICLRQICGFGVLMCSTLSLKMNDSGYCCLIVVFLLSHYVSLLSNSWMSFYSLFASGLQYTASKWKGLSRAKLPHISFVILQEDESIHHLAESIDILDS